MKTLEERAAILDLPGQEIKVAVKDRSISVDGESRLKQRSSGVSVSVWVERRQIDAHRCRDRVRLDSHCGGVLFRSSFHDIEEVTVNVEACVDEEMLARSPTHVCPVPIFLAQMDKKLAPKTRKEGAM